MFIGMQEISEVKSLHTQKEKKLNVKTGKNDYIIVLVLL